MVSSILYSMTERCGEPAFADRRLRRSGGRAPQAARPATPRAGRRGPGGARRAVTACLVTPLLSAPGLWACPGHLARLARVVREPERQSERHHTGVGWPGEGGAVRKGIVVLLVATGVALAAVVIVPPLLRPADLAIAAKAVGTWREIDTPEAFKLRISPDARATLYHFTYPRSSNAALMGGLEDDHINIWGENASAVMWVVTYDERRDMLTLTRPRGGEAHTFQRLTAE
jgi:hypothetical protein